MKPSDVDPEQVEREVKAVSGSRLDPRLLGDGATDLSRAAVAARAKARADGREGGHSGRDLIRIAAGNLAQANRLRKVAQRRSGKRAKRAERLADEALRTAAAQIRLASVCPLNRGYLHALTIQQVQTAKAEAGAAFGENPAALAVDTHRRIREQRLRMTHGE